MAAYLEQHARDAERQRLGHEDQRNRNEMRQRRAVPHHARNLREGFRLLIDTIAALRSMSGKPLSYGEMPKLWQ